MRRVTSRTRKPSGRGKKKTTRRKTARFRVDLPRSVYMVSGAAIAGLVVIGIVRSLFAGDVGGGIGRLAVSASAGLGLRVEEVLLEGRQNAPRLQILNAVAVQRGDPLLSVDLKDIRKRLEAIAWVREATVQRHWPDRIHIQVSERRPIALWQHGKRLILVDESGASIRTAKVDQFRHLLVIVGKDAPKHAEKLLGTLATQPALRQRVLAAIRVGKRRWDVRFRSGVEVLLPEEDMSAAWARLARLERDHGVIKKNVQLIDLRLPDRLIVRTKTKPTPARGRGGQPT